MLPIITSFPFIALMLSSAAAGYDLKPTKINLSSGLARMNSLVDLTWVDKKIFDRDEAQATLNSLKQYTVTIEGITVPFIYQKSNVEGAKPLITLHGWIGSIHEFSRVAKPLTQSAPITSNGKNISGIRHCANWTIDDTARIFNTLMVYVLGYATYAIHGTDVGSGIAYSVYSQFPATVRAAQFTFIPFFPLSTQQLADANITLDAFGEFAHVRSTQYIAIGLGYFTEQLTKANTIGLALQDNPIGQLA
ncbi:Alpha/Beta hydrolase protein [Mycena epipterygia]|nr:Alpha/Beta hydrolase protein [Mycena epipterygia]